MTTDPLRQAVIDWHDSECGQWDGTALDGQPMSLSCDCGFPEALAEARALGRAEALAAVRTADATLRSEVERIVGNGESWARYHAYPVLVAALAAIDKVER